MVEIASTESLLVDLKRAGGDAGIVELDGARSSPEQNDSRSPHRPKNLHKNF
jgi:hypothetical protein